MAAAAAAAGCQSSVRSQLFLREVSGNSQAALRLALYATSGLTSTPLSLVPPPPPQCPPAHELTRRVLKKTIQKGVQDRVNDFWKEKIGLYVMQGDYLALIIEEGICISWKSYMWDVP